MAVARSGSGVSAYLSRTYCSYMLALYELELIEYPSVLKFSSYKIAEAARGLDS